MNGPSATAKLPRGGFPDSTLALLRDPYRFISKTCKKLETDLFETRLQLEPAICMTGKSAAELFYDEKRFMRDGAAPPRIQKTLFGVGGVQGLDGEEHRHRKGLFMSAMEPERVRELGQIFERFCEDAAARWESTKEVSLYDASRELLTRAVCLWSGVPLAEAEVEQRVAELTAMYDWAGSVGPKHWKSRRARESGERWAKGLIEQARALELKVREDRALGMIANHRDERGKLLEAEVAAVELLNVLRPTVAVSVYIAFVGLALHDFPECRAKFASARNGYSRCFAQEVRRYYPFFPAVVGRVRRDFEWRGYRFPQGRLTLLDLYGTNHDAREWDQPESFLPERFEAEARCPFSFVPQGGGDARIGHRCPGEGVALELMEVAARFLVNRLVYEFQKQDLSVARSRLPALPRSGIVMTSVRRKKRSEKITTG